MGKILKGIFTTSAIALACFIIVVGALQEAAPEEWNVTTQTSKTGMTEAKETEADESGAEKEETVKTFPEISLETENVAQTEETGGTEPQGETERQTELVSEAETEFEEGILPDTSQGHYYMAAAAEHDGYLYYYDNGEKQILRKSTDGGNAQVLITETSDWELPGMLMVTDQYLYVRLTYPVGYRIAQFTLDGEYIDMVGDLQALSLHFQDGYFYYVEGRLCRKEAREGSLTEYLVEESTDPDFEIYHDTIFYKTENQKLCQVDLDGSSQKQLTGEEGRFTAALLGKVFGNKVYYNAMDLEEGGYHYYRQDLTTMAEELAPVWDPENGYPSSGGFFIGDIFIYYVYGEEDGIWGYNAETGEEICYFTEKENGENGYNEEAAPVYVAGATRLYYSLTYKDYDMGDWEDELYCVDLDGSNPVCMGKIVIL